jgi:hypothetical protein
LSAVLAQPRHEDLSRAGGHREQGVIAADVGIAVVEGGLFLRPYVSQIVESRSIVKGAAPGPAPAPRRARGDAG